MPRRIQSINILQFQFIMSYLFSETKFLHAEKNNQFETSEVGPWEYYEQNDSIPKLKYKQIITNSQSLPIINQSHVSQRIASIARPKRIIQQNPLEVIKNNKQIDDYQIKSFKLDPLHQRLPMLNKSLSITGHQAKQQRSSQKNSIVYIAKSNNVSKPMERERKQISATKKNQSHLRTVPEIPERISLKKHIELKNDQHFREYSLHNNQKPIKQLDLQRMNNDSYSNLNTKRESSCQTTFVLLPLINDNQHQEIDKQAKKTSPNYEKLIQKAMDRRRIGARFLSSKNLLFELMRDYSRFSNKKQHFSNRPFLDKL